ncbi:MAG: Germination-specific N-acetylmuramoyl-L-alanine amidase precursor [Pelotomaculum sp. PtaB.Bin104]|nr:MAG: Germination-specific N-acetylmuramoyl-L-alanine amidase precursor [Pelotomaculum sp. PtaB.Bin104]
MPIMVVNTFRIKKWVFIAFALLLLIIYLLTAVFRERDARHEVEAPSWVIKSKVIVIDPGHKGVDSGDVGNIVVLEKEISRAIAKRLAAILGQSGAVVMMTGETGTGDNETGTIGLPALANGNEVNLYIGIHVNSNSSVSRHGAQTFVQSGFPDSKQAGQAIQSTLSDSLKNTDRLTREVDNNIASNINVPAVLVEVGFINENNSMLLQDSVYQDKIAWAIYTGTVKFFEQSEKTDRQAVQRDIINVFKEQEPDYLNEP